jgi:hypothetical protein
MRNIHVQVVKITATQLDALAAIRAGQVTMNNCGHAAFRIDGPAHPSVVGMCIKNGWAVWPKGGVGDGQICELTEEGVVALAAARH